METFLNSGLFWGSIAAIVAAILGILSNLPKKSSHERSE